MKKEKLREKIENSKCFMKDWFIGACESYGSDSLSDVSIAINESVLLNKKRGYIWVVVAFENDAVSTPVEQLGLFLTAYEALKKNQFDVEPFFEKSAFSFFLRSDKSEIATVEYAMSAAEIVRNTLNKLKVFDYGIGIGRAGRDLTRVRESYILAQEASKYRYALGMGRIIYIGDVEPDMRVNDYHAIRESDFRTSLKIGSEQMNYEVVSDIFGHIKRNNDPLDIAKRISLELLVSANRAIYELGKDPAMLFDKTDIWSVINRCSDVDELHQLILNTSQLVIMRIFQKQVPKDKTIVEKAKRIIDEDFGSKLSLEIVAKKIYISPCYLSTVFSRETGMTFKDYLINSRISRAKGLLHDPSAKIYNVAKAVGYSDARYFSDLFRKRVGMTPAEYRKNLLMKN